MFYRINWCCIEIYVLVSANSVGIVFNFLFKYIMHLFIILGQWSVVLYLGVVMEALKQVPSRRKLS